MTLSVADCSSQKVKQIKFKRSDKTIAPKFKRGEIVVYEGCEVTVVGFIYEHLTGYLISYEEVTEDIDFQFTGDYQLLIESETDPVEVDESALTATQE